SRLDLLSRRRTRSAAQRIGPAPRRRGRGLVPAAGRAEAAAHDPARQRGRARCVRTSRLRGAGRSRDGEMALLEDVVTYLEMTERPARTPAPAPRGPSALMRVEKCPISYYRYLYK